VDTRQKFCSPDSSDSESFLLASLSSSEEEYLSRIQQMQTQIRELQRDLHKERWSKQQQDTDGSSHFESMEIELEKTRNEKMVAETNRLSVDEFLIFAISLHLNEV